MNAATFAQTTRAPGGLIPHLIFLNAGDDFSAYLREPDDWHSLSQAEQTLHGIKLLDRAWRHLRKKLPPHAFTGVDRDSVLETAFSTLAAAKITPSIRNPGAYLFTAVRNAASAEIKKQHQPHQHGDNLGDLFNFHVPHRRNGQTVHVAREWTDATGFDPPDWLSIQEAYTLLDSLCKDDNERSILYERWRKPSVGHLFPEWCCVIAKKLGLSLIDVTVTLECLQTRYVEAVNEIRRQRHQRKISAVTLTHVAVYPVPYLGDIARN